MKLSLSKFQLVLVLSLAVFSAGVVGLTYWALTPSYYFEVSMRSSTGGMAQTFYDIGRGFNEPDSVRLDLHEAKSTAVYRFPFPGAEYRSIRFDPLDHGNADIVINYARVVDVFGRTVRDFSPRDITGMHDISKFEILGRGITFKLGPTENDSSLTISLTTPLILTGRTAKLLYVARAFLLCFAGLSGLGFLLALLTPRIRRIVTPWRSTVVAWSRQRPRRALLIVAIISVVLSCYPIVFFGKTFATANNTPMLYDEPHIMPGDHDTEIEDFKGSDNGAMAWQNLPYSFLQSRGFARYGELPLWNRFNSCGTPLLAQGLTMSGDPLQVIPLFAGGATWAWDIKFLMAKMFFCWALGLTVLASCRHFPAALLLCCSSAFIGFFSFRFDHPAYFSMCYAPWILLGWIEVARATTRRSVIAWVMVVFIASWAELNSGSAKEASMLLVSLHGCGMLALILGARKNRLEKFFHLSFGGLAFVLISTPVWLTFWDALKESYVPYKEAALAFQIQPGLLVGLFDEIFYRIVNSHHAVFDPSANFFVLLGCLLALVYLRSLIRDPTFLAIGLSTLPCFALVFGVIPPALIKATPMLKSVWHVDNSFSCPLIIELFVIAGFGLRCWWTHCVRKDWKLDLGLFALALVAVMGAYLGFTHAVQRAPNDFWPLGGTLVPDTFFYAYSLSLIGATLCLPWVAARMIRRRRVSLLAAGLAFACLVILHWRHGFQLRTNIEQVDDYIVNPSLRIDLKTPSPAIEFLRSQPGPFRTVGFGSVFYPGYPMIAGLESIHGTDPLMNPYYHELLLDAGLKLQWGWKWVVEKANLKTTLPLYNLLNLRYFLDVSLASEDAGDSLIKLASLDLSVYKNNNAWPRAFFADEVRTYDTIGQFLGMIRELPNQPLAAVQKGDIAAAAMQTAIESANRNRIIPARDYRLTNNTTTFAVDAPGPGVVVLTEAYLPNDFIAQVNGIRSEYFRVNHAFRGIRIPKAGTYVVSFSYWPKHFTIALWMAAAGAVLLVGWLVLALRKNDRGGLMVEQQAHG
jgi:hypothetical protein